MHHFFVTPEQVKENQIWIEGSDVNHIKNVLRMKIGEELQISDGDNKKYLCEILSFEAMEICLLIKEELEKSGIQVNGIFERDDLTGFNWSTVPVVLVEMGFLSNYTEDQMMSNPEYQNKLMQAVCEGLDEYFTKK